MTDPPVLTSSITKALELFNLLKVIERVVEAPLSNKLIISPC